MESTNTILLSSKQIQQRIDRIAYQVYEDNTEEKEIIVAGIRSTGYQVAEMLSAVLKKIAPFNIQLIDVQLDKHSQTMSEIRIPLTGAQLQGKVIILVDDVLNSGKTMMYALKPFLAADIKKIRTAVLVDRNHRRYPIAADYVGHSLATTLQEHVTVEIENGKASAILS
ncbi:MAG: phosphoribosyltransferase [Bacteroidetes bacterium]|nr:phosphoribosyltransferase [Bacteroidota bacterium]MBL0063750.1 phosphoribosyltransferase [Bacteroidota bacterium]MBL0139823.1 phosphoribosyltransferase [Bacteroidota bacterium]